MVLDKKIEKVIEKLKHEMRDYLINELINKNTELYHGVKEHLKKSSETFIAKEVENKIENIKENFEASLKEKQEQKYEILKEKMGNSLDRLSMEYMAIEMFKDKTKKEIGEYANSLLSECRAVLNEHNAIFNEYENILEKVAILLGQLKQPYNKTSGNLEELKKAPITEGQLEVLSYKKDAIQKGSERDFNARKKIIKEKLEELTRRNLKRKREWYNAPAKIS